MGWGGGGMGGASKFLRILVLSSLGVVISLTIFQISSSLFAFSILSPLCLIVSFLMQFVILFRSLLYLSCKTCVPQAKDNITKEKLFQVSEKIEIIQKNDTLSLVFLVL